MRRTNSWMYFLGSVGLIVVAILLSALLQRTRGTVTESKDIRARAGNPTALQMTARVVSVDDGKNEVVVDNLQLSGENSQNLGEWTVTPGPLVNLGALVSGRNITLGVDASTFSIDTHTFTALEIRPQR